MRARLLVAVALLVGVLAPFVQPSPAAAAAYTLTTRASYTVQPDARRIDVGIAATFRNTTPNPPGQFSVFSELKLAVQDGAASVAARDASGPLTAGLKRESGVNVITVRLRSGVRYAKQANVSVTYQLPDGGAAGLRVRPSAVVFPAWGFGTSSAVTIAIPTGYDVRTDGDQLTAASDATGTTLTSGAIGDPSSWLSLVVATRPTEFTTTSRSVPLDGGTMDLQVRSFDDDEAWGTTTADLLARAMPRLQAALGLAYVPQGPVVVTESAEASRGGLGEGSGTASELLVAFDQPAFTILHQAAHLWLSRQVASDRWIREGLASWAAASVAGDLDVSPPFDPAARVAALKATAFPLATWGTEAAADADAEAYGYAASWQLTEEIVAAVGVDGLRTALRRVVAGRSAYEAVGPEAPAPGAVPAQPVDSRRFLDQLEAVGTADLTTTFGTTVFPSDAAGELTQRAAAREAEAGLIARSSDWGAPTPVTDALAAWDFASATTAIQAATTWLEARDRLFATIADAGLTTPARLRETYVRDGGGSQATTELKAESAVVDAYRAALVHSVGERSLLERIGLLAGPAPSAILVHANGAFADGDLQVALDDVRHADDLLSGAETAGIVRLVSALLVLIAALGVAIWLLRRRAPSRR